MTPQERTMRARLGAHAMHAQGKTNTAPARAAFEQRFLDEVDPERVLSESERNKRAHHAQQAYMTRLSLKAVQAKRRKAGSASD